ncbi:hypothetical protein [Vibrio marisflavi]|uniref:Uncharacterized protein n=1 Tax=Vibrio marisflavi CECT 7928 TaxID=634439 RepID=A0ABN8DZ51_9VIBR|nr:hypothetical protein [Vibrio marisflavi]CAH0536700.1 hypothetical protein VMF7928_00636 [Vibrio marisflavi CECT 7928]
MKVVIEFLETGHYKDNAWEGDMYIEKGERRAVTPAYAAQLVDEKKAIFQRVDEEK